jgi:hypothetical protein
MIKMNPVERDVQITLLASRILYYCRLPLGPTTNKMYMPVATRGKSRFVRTKEYKAWQNMVDMIEVIEGDSSRFPVGSPDAPVGVMIIVHGVDIDPDNCAKCHIDFLVRGGVLTDDDISVVKSVLVVAGQPLIKRQCAEIIVYPASEFGWIESQKKFAW